MLRSGALRGTSILGAVSAKSAPAAVLSAVQRKQLEGIVKDALKHADRLGSEHREGVRRILDAAESEARRQRSGAPAQRLDAKDLRALAEELTQFASLLRGCGQAARRLDPNARALVEGAPRFDDERYRRPRRRPILSGSALPLAKGESFLVKVERPGLSFFPPTEGLFVEAEAALRRLRERVELGADDGRMLAATRGRPKHTPASVVARNLARAWEEESLSFVLGADDAHSWPEFVRCVFEAIGLPTWRRRAREEARRRRHHRR
jgi:uncharacterized membrane protein